MKENKYSDVDAFELIRFKKDVTRRNSSDVDRDIVWLKEMKRFQVNIYDPQVRMTVIQSYHFIDELAAKEAVAHAEKTSGGEAD